jgi:hypothetical protein
MTKHEAMIEPLQLAKVRLLIPIGCLHDEMSPPFTFFAYILGWDHSQCGPSDAASKCGASVAPALENPERSHARLA